MDGEGVQQRTTTGDPAVGEFQREKQKEVCTLERCTTTK
jgi:hypothetical protein